jgi:hypothetical protein
MYDSRLRSFRIPNYAVEVNPAIRQVQTLKRTGTEAGATENIEAQGFLLTRSQHTGLDLK